MANDETLVQNQYSSSVYQNWYHHHHHQQQQEPSWAMELIPNTNTRRYSSPQMGYYDLITGEYRYRSADSTGNQWHGTGTQPAIGSPYAGEMEPPMCENSCPWCQIKLPLNCLTVSFITTLMLLIMFSLFQAILVASRNSSNSNNGRGKPQQQPVNMSLFNDMILLMAILTGIFFLLTIVRYICIDRFRFGENNGSCQRCRLIGVIIGDSFSTSHSSSKHITIPRSEYHSRNNDNDEDNGQEQFV